MNLKTTLKMTLVALVLGASSQVMSDEVIARYQTPWGSAIRKKEVILN